MIVALACGVPVGCAGADPTHESAPEALRQAYIHFQSGQYERVRDSLEAFLDRPPRHAATPYQDARALNALGIVDALLYDHDHNENTFQQAEQRFKKAVGRLEHHPELSFLLSEVLTNLGHLYSRNDRSPELAQAALRRARSIEEQLGSKPPDIESFLAPAELDASFLGPLTLPRELDELIKWSANDTRQPAVLLFAREGLRALERQGALDDPAAASLVHDFALGMTSRPGEAEAAFRRAEALWRARGELVDALQAKLEVAHLRIAEGQFGVAQQELESLSEEAASLRRRRGPDAELTRLELDLRQALAEVLEAQDKVAAAKAVLDKDFDELLQSEADADVRRIAQQLTLQIRARLAARESDIPAARLLLQSAERIHAAHLADVHLSPRDPPLDTLLLRARIAAAASEPTAAAEALMAASRTLQKTPSWSRRANDVRRLLAHVVDLATGHVSNAAAQQVAALSMLTFFGEDAPGRDPGTPPQSIRDDGVAQRLDTYRQARAAIATALLRPAIGGTELLRLGHDVAAARDELDASLRALPRDADATGSLSLDRVQGALPDGGCLVAYLRIAADALKAPPLTIEHAPEPSYHALTLCKGSSPRVLRLASAHEVEAAITRYRAAMREARADDLPGQLEALGEVSRLLLAPVLAGRQVRPKALIVLPAAEVSFVSFAALPTDDGRFLIEQLPVSYLSSPDDLLPRPEAGARSAGVVIGDPAYGAPSATAGPGSGGMRQNRFSGRDRGTWPGLPITHEEASAVAGLLQTDDVHFGQAATADRVLAVRGPRYLHIATHGYFVDEGCTSCEIELPRARSREDLLAMLEVQALRLDPLLYSGLVFAGINDEERTGGGSISRLTALHVANLDLHGTRLTSLSACESGLGVPGQFVGLQGMRTALSSAGSLTQLLSLWRVHTETSTSIMVGFYERLACGVDEAEALRQSQNEARRTGPRAVPPFYWAPYTLSGDVATAYGVAPSGGMGQCMAAGAR